jgi:hypothetical protein
MAKKMLELSQCRNGFDRITKGRKMNKVQIADIVALFPLESDTAKSLVNRLDSALGKEGSASSRLKMASASILAQSGKLPEDDQDALILTALGSFLLISAEIAVDNTPAPSTNAKPKAEKKTREKWFDADSPEAQAITTPKPSKSGKTAPAPAVNLDAVAKLLTEILAGR